MYELKVYTRRTRVWNKMGPTHHVILHEQKLWLHISKAYCQLCLSFEKLNTWHSTLFNLLPNYFINKKGPMNPPFMLNINLNPTKKFIKNNVGIIIWSFIWTTLWYIIGVRFKLITFLTFVHGLLNFPQQIGVGGIWRHSFETLDEL